MSVVYAAIEGMVSTLGDPFSVFMPPDESNNFSASLEGELEGIGAYIGLNNGKIEIISPLQNSPAQKAGLKPNDQIIAVDGENILDLPLFEVIKKIKGPQGTFVEISVLRKNKKKTFKIKRAKISIESVKLEINNNIAIVSINQFLMRTHTEFQSIIPTITNNSKIKGIVLDLRNNPGGLLSVSLDILGHFVKKDDIIIRIEYPNIIYLQKSKGLGEFQDYPIVVLVNEGSASASEIIAGALQDLELATIIGTTTYGKGTVQELSLYNDGSNLKLTVAKWLTPNGRWINETGLEPDIVIENPDNLRTDDQMERALKELR